jgi:glycyl-tRNA synthetase beta chain
MARTLLLEIGCEELPTSFVRGALAQLPSLARDELARHRITHGAVRALGTPRRLTVVIDGVEEAIAPQTEVLLGPPESAAKDKDGKWTKAAEGFAKKNGLAIEALSIADTDKGRYLRAERVLAGGSAKDKLGDVLGSLCAKVSFEKSMRWADIDTAFGRPVQWLLALFGTDVVDFEFVRVRSGRSTFGHRFLAPERFELANADDYVSALRAKKVLVDPKERLDVQREGLVGAAQANGGTLVENSFLAEEVLGLVEWPFVVVGRFDEAFLTLPDELIETVMSFHQRYFAARSRDGKLLPLFITTVNTALDADRIRKGNERVMRARLNDARFFVDKDRSEPLSARSPRLSGIVYHQKLGTYADKVLRVEALSAEAAKVFGADAAQCVAAARLCKCDLLTLTVGEFPELQGFVGRDLARNDGLDAAVCEAIAEHYLPRGAEDSVALSKLGAALAVADRLDTLAGFFAIGQKPSGGGDPFGLRRSALGVLRTLLHHEARASLSALVTSALASYVGERFASLDRGAAHRDLVSFLRERLEVALSQRFGVDVVRACLETQGDDCDPFDVFERAQALHSLRGNPQLGLAAKCIERATNISKDVLAHESRTSLVEWLRGHSFAMDEERALQRVVLDVEAQVTGSVSNRDYRGAVSAIADGLTTPLDQFFSKVFVMDEDLAKRDARLRLLKLVTLTSGAVCRFDLLSDSKK